MILHYETLKLSTFLDDIFKCISVNQICGILIRMHFYMRSWQKGGINTLRPRQNGRRFADDTFTRIFLNENVRISIKISLKFVPKGPINNNPALVQIMARRRSGDKPLSEPMMVSLLTHICVTRPQWVSSDCRMVPNRSHVTSHNCITIFY